MPKNEATDSNPARSIFLLVEKLKEANAALSRMLSDVAAQLGQGTPRLHIVAGSTYAYSGSVLDEPEKWVKEYFGYVMGPDYQTNGKVPANIIIVCAQYHHESLIDCAELWFAVGKAEKVKSLSHPPYWISVRGVKYWSEGSLPDYGIWSGQKSMSSGAGGAMQFQMARQPLSALQDSAAVEGLVVEPLRQLWGGRAPEGISS